MTQSAERVILITADSLRADVLGGYGGPARTPALDGLAAESLWFERAFATGPHTTHSFPGILASNYPTSGGTVQTLAGRTSVAECFRDAGWRTGAFHSNPLLSRRRGYGRGFETFWDSLPDAAASGESAGRGGALRGLADGLGQFLAGRCPPVFRAARRAYRALARCLRRPEPPHVRAEEINSRAVAWLEDREGPFFLWLHYMDPHWPYGTELAELSPAERRGARRLSRKALRRPAALTGTELGRLRELYRLEVEYLDRSVGGLFDRLRRAGLWDGCAVALTSDHGQGFGEHGATFHGDLLYDELIRVPLIVRAPGLAPERREGVASLIDLSPTLCALAGLEAAATFEGRSLLDGPAREAVFAETAYRLFVSERPKRVAVRTADWKLIRNCEADTEELYDVEADPGETADLLDGRPEVAERMRRLLRGHLERERPPIAPDRSRWRPEEEEAVKARLRALGYMDEAEQ